MNKLSKLLLFVLSLCTPLLPQTLLMKPGNAAQYSVERVDIIKLCTDSLKEINGNSFYLFKGFSPGEPNSAFYSYEGVHGDSLYQALNNSETEQFHFNYNWPLGFIISSDTSEFIHNTVLDSIVVVQDDIWIDTLYRINSYNIDLSSGDTISVNPYMTVSKKFGVIELPLSILKGKKIDGIRYGIVDPFPEEVYLSHDSIYLYHRYDSLYFTIYNTSDSVVRIDSIHHTMEFSYWVIISSDTTPTYIDLYYPYYSQTKIKFTL